MSEKNPLVEEQSPPVPNGGVSVWDMVVADMQDRDRHGREKYGVPVQPHNGRDPLVDQYQEILDAAVYSRQAIEERRLLRAELVRLRAVLADRKFGWTAKARRLREGLDRLLARMPGNDS